MPLHPRLKILEGVLNKHGYSIRKYNFNNNNNIINKMNIITLNYFDLVAIMKSVKYIIKYSNKSDTIYIQDLKYLPIALIAKALSKKVIYETLDNNAELHFYHLSKKYGLIKNFVFIKKVISSIEKKIATKYCNYIIVNSKALLKYFRGGQVKLLYYCSPFENKFYININNETALLYLGGFWESKGADIMLNLVEKYKIKLFVFGDINYNEYDIVNKLEYLSSKNKIVYNKRLPPSKLEKELKILLEKYKLIGLSIIKSVHESYATQEANKEIDYLAMGIPIIGNYRKPTKEKIDAGCGVFYDNDLDVKRLLKNKNFYNKISNKCLKYYNKYYSKKLYERKLLKIIRNVSKTD